MQVTENKTIIHRTADVSGYGAFDHSIVLSDANNEDRYRFEKKSRSGGCKACPSLLSILPNSFSRGLPSGKKLDEIQCAISLSEFLEPDDLSEGADGGVAVIRTGPKALISLMCQGISCVNSPAGCQIIESMKQDDFGVGPDQKYIIIGTLGIMFSVIEVQRTKYNSDVESAFANLRE